jgi:hypothetical protein
MFYGKLAEDGTLAKWPYSITELKRDHPNVSFTKEISPETLASFGVVSISRTEQPPYLYDKEYVRGVIANPDGTFAEIWTYRDLDPATLAERTAGQAESVRFERNEKLSACDWTQLSDATVDAATWATYRQALRDVPQQAGFPWEITWPTEPA